MTRRVSYFTDSSGFGGAERALLILLAGLDRSRWEPTLVFHPSPGVEPLVEAAREMEVSLWPVRPMPDGLTGAKRILPFLRALRARPPAVFHAHLTWPLACKFGLVSAVLARVPAVVATEQLFFEFGVSTSISLQQRLVAAGVDRYLAVSQDTAKRLLETFRWPAEKVQVVYNAVEPAPFDAQPDPVLRKFLSRRRGRPVVFTAARLEEQKGHRYLLESATEVPEAQFVFAGDGPERAALEAQAASLGLDDRVMFLGRRHDIPEILACCDAFVLPSLWEGLPLSVLEAMAAGKPVVASDVGGTGEAVLHEETGLLVPAGDRRALAKAIRAVLDDPALAHRLGSAGRKRVRQKFSAAEMVHRITSVYEELLDQKAIARRP